MSSYLSWLPILLFLTTAVAFTISYIIAVADKDVNPFWPYISDTGTKPPESCIFGQLLNISAVLALACMYVRFKLVQAFNNHDKTLKVFNVVSLLIGVAASIGVSLVANFQESNVIQVHLTGALMAFGLGTIYCFFHSVITRRMYPMYNGLAIWAWRLAISIICLIALILTGVFSGIAGYEIGASSMDVAFNSREWNSTMPGYSSHLVSTISEWIIGIAFLSFFLTYFKDFKKIAIRVLPELLVSHLDETPIVFNSGPTERTGLLA
ncbi:DNA damage-regulated autophagy modulator protein 1-like isoform X2 [Watersipora subatra]